MSELELIDSKDVRSQAQRAPKEIPSIERYSKALDGAIGWLHRSIRHGNGGSSGYFGIWGRWSKPYPETTGYIIPTLLDYSNRTDDSKSWEAAANLGRWLLGIQAKSGYWHGGFHPPRFESPSVFNTGQILLGMCALYRETGEERWIESAQAGARWLASGVNAKGEWAGGNYTHGFNPSYYTRVAWPMLATWSQTGDEEVRDAAERVLRAVVARVQANGVIRDWSFEPGKPAFTHTIAYTIRGLIESSFLVGDWDSYGSAAEEALERLYRKAELARGRLPGAFRDDWSGLDDFTCLTGNAQVAICLLRYYERAEDLRLVNAACKLVDNVCGSQSLNHPIAGIRGGIAGSRPVWGPYIKLRYPNWASKFFADALMTLMTALREAQQSNE